MPPKDTKQKSANSAKQKSKTPGPGLQTVEYVFDYFVIHVYRLLSSKFISETKNQFFTFE